MEIASQIALPLKMAKKTFSLSHFISECFDPRRPAFLIWAGITSLLLYLGLSWFALFPQAVWSPDEGAKLLQLKNLRIEKGHLAFDIPYFGYAFDRNLEFAQPDPSAGLLQVCGTSLCLRRLPVFTLFVYPFFRGLGFYGLYLLPAISGALTGILALLLLPRNDRRPGMWVLIAFGSPIFIYSTIFWEHTLSVCLSLFGALLTLQTNITKQQPKIYLSLIFAGIILGLSIYIRLETLIFVLAWLVAYWIIFQDRRREINLAGISLAVTLMLYPFLHQNMLGQPFPENARYLLYPFHYLSRAKWQALPDLLIGPPKAEAMNYGWLGELWALCALVAVAHSFGLTISFSKRLLQMAGLVTTAIVGSFFLFNPAFYRSAHGLIFTTPWALLGICRAQEVWHRGDRQTKVVVLSVMLGLIGYTIGIIVLRSSDPHGGLEWGARFAIVFYPLLSLIAAWDSGAKPLKVGKLIIFSALTFLGIGFQIRGIWTIHHDKQINALLNRAILETSDRYIVSDLWWLPFNAAPIYPQKGVFVAVTPERIGAWIKRAKEFQVQRFYLVTLDWDIVKKVSYADESTLKVISTRCVENLLLFEICIENNPVR